MDREPIIEAGVSTAAVVVFVVAVVVIGVVFPADLQGTGALSLIGAIAFFVLLMSVAGYVLSRRVT